MNHRSGISLIAAMNRLRAIGLRNALLWHLPRDLRHFRETTTGKPVIMGRSTFESIGRKLPRRTNVILSRRCDYSIDGCVVVGSIDEALRAAGTAEEVMIIGGAQIYEQFLPHAERIYLTRVDNDLDGDAFFPAFEGDAWAPSASTSYPPDAENAYGCTFVTYERVRASSSL